MENNMKMPRKKMPRKKMPRKKRPRKKMPIKKRFKDHGIVECLGYNKIQY